MSDDDYNDEFSDGEGNFASDYQPAEQDDEQHAQKVNGMIETLQTRVEELQMELFVEKAKWDESQRDKSLERAVIEMERYKSMCERLKEKLDTPMNSNNSDISQRLRVEFLSYCKRNKLFTEFNVQDMNEENCIKILSNALPKPPSSSKPMISDSSSVGESFGGSESSMMQRIKELEHELHLALGAAEDIRALKAKLLQMVERNRQEKEIRLRTELEVQHSKKKVDMLSDHMEKLMAHLKLETAMKLRVVEQLRQSEKENTRIKEKCDLVIRKGVAKDRLILELREGSKVLEDQLRLMDEKYLELRTKLDWARELGAKKIRKAELKAKELRAKFALAGNVTLLDSVQLPGIRTPAGSNISGYDSGFDEPSTWSGKGGKRSNHSKLTTFSTRSSTEQSDDGFKKPEISMDSVLEKIRKQQGARQVWTPEKLKELTKPKI